MLRSLRRLARDNTTLSLVIILLCFGVFVAWQITRLGNDGTTAGTVTTSLGTDSVDDVIAAQESVPPARPQLRIRRWTTANGARVLFVPAPELPMLDVRVVFDAGGARDGSLPGLARFTSALVGEGTRTRSVDEVSSGFESVGAEFSASSYRDMAIVELRTLAADSFLEPALALFTEVVAEPSFPRDAVERTREQMLVGLRRDEEEPGTIAARAYMAALYLVHPYATPPEGTAQSVAAIRADDLAAFHRRHYVARNAVIALTGAVDRATAEKIAGRIAAALPAGEPAPGLPEPPGPRGGKFHVRFDSQQTHLFIGLPAVRRGDPDEPALLVANEVLGGGGLTSLLADEVRNKRGLAYSVGSGFQAMRTQGPFTVNMQTRNEAAAEAQQVTLKTLKRFAEKGPTAAQLDDARRQVIGSYALANAGNAAIVGTLGMIGFYGLPDDYLEQQLAAVEKLSAEDVRAAFNRHVPLERLLVVTLGPAQP